MCDQDGSEASPAQRNWLEELQTFAQEFEKDGIPSAPRGNVGLGPIKYQVSFSTNEGINEKHVKLIDDAIHLEQLLGNYWINMEALLMLVTFGKEDPIGWLPSAQRCAIRFELRENTAKYMSSNGLLQDTLDETAELADIIRSSTQLSILTNPAELSLVSAFVPRTIPLMAADGLVLGNNMDAHANMEDLAKLVDRYRKYKVRVDAVHGLVFKLLNGSLEKTQWIHRRKTTAHDEQPTAGLSENIKKQVGS